MKNSHFVAFASCFALIAGGLWIGCENQIEAPGTMTLQTRSAIEVLPADVQFVGMVNLPAMRNNTAFNPFDATSIGAELGARMQDFIDATGFNPEEDLGEVYVAMNDLGPEPQPSFVAYATFDRERLQSYLEANMDDTFERVAYKGITIYQSQRDEHPLALALAAENMIVGSTTLRGVERMLDRLSEEGAALKDEAETMDLIALASRGSSAWFVARNLDAPFSSETGSAKAVARDIVQIGQALQDVAVAVNVQQDGVEGIVFLKPKMDVSSSDVADLTKGLIAAGKASQDLADTERRLLDQIQVRTHDDQVRVQFFVDNAALASVH